MNATKRWKCPDNYWDGIFTEHVLEHFSYNDAIYVIGECYRTLKPGAWVRISVPDINKFIDFQSLSDKHRRLPVAISIAAQHHGHVSVWDPSLMMDVAAECGFTNIRETGFGRGTDEKLIKDQEMRREESLYVEARKPNKEC
jgi:predicted SAM-dependent methyltransferase